ncbi:hypothetical protein BCR37DRAFT_393809 [Protomyces lactucae-debilis]|uniref:Uncharacterized protein n=1 Tax=Protomyces lactucae-debilis TaxID=2754530 RepID=A0A1Y2F978_PROLT|nr:uncharacterized protein BCR37DRAFT_393809 [Protomyces lactucae-debilis]ORY80449.1 hypothetical protein BCR37DRAFT_393809 [Protomyces lactucae-debilis]
MVEHHAGNSASIFLTFDSESQSSLLPSRVGASLSASSYYLWPIGYKSTSSDSPSYTRSWSFTQQELLDKMPIGRTLLYGFVGFVALGTAFSMWSDPLEPEIAAASNNPSEWSVAKLKRYLQENHVPLPGLDQASSNLSAEQQAEQRALVLDDLSHRQLIKLVKQHRQATRRPAQETASASEQSPLLASASADAANERLLSASNLK